MQKFSSVPAKGRDDPSSVKVEPDLSLFDDNKLFSSRRTVYGHLPKNETEKVDCTGDDGSAYLDSSSSSDSDDFLKTCKRQRRDFTVHSSVLTSETIRAPLPYLIRPCKKPDIHSGFDLYNDFLGSLFDTDGSDCSQDESDYSQDDENDEDYVILENVECLPNSKEATRLASDKRKLLNASSASPLLSDEPSEGFGTRNHDNFAGCSNQEDNDGQPGSVISNEKETVDQHDHGDAESTDEDWVIVE